MSLLRQRAVVFLGVVATLAVLACETAQLIDPETGESTWDSVTPQSDVLRAIDASLQLQIVDRQGRPVTVTGVSWRLLDEGIVRIEQTGRVTAVAPGTARIVVETSSQADTVTIRVRQDVAAVTLSPATPSLVVGTTQQLGTTLRDANGFPITESRPTSWTSSASTVASVSGSGLVTAHGAGTATIQASSEERSGSTTVTVTAAPPPPPVPVASVTLSPTTLALTVGATGQLTATPRDAGGAALTGRAVTWSTSAASIAAVSNSGVVTAVAPGSATITATSEGRSTTAAITVTAPVVPVASVTMNPTTLALTVGQTGQLTATPRRAPGTALTGRLITWTTTAASVATVSSSGLVTAVAAGTATIRATSEGQSATATVTVTTSSPGPTLFSDTFESGSLGDAGRWHDIVGNGASIVTASSEGISAVSGTKVLKLTASGVGMTHFVATGSTSPYQRLYLSFRYYRTSGYQANGGFRTGGIRGSTDQWGSFGVGWGTPGSCPDDPNNVNQQEFMFAYAIMDPAAGALRTYTNWLGQKKLTVNPPTCGGGYAIGAGNTPEATYHDINFAPSVGAWHHYEIEVQLNDVGQSNGWQRMWVDGVLKIEHLNVRYRTTSGMKLWAVTFDTGNVFSGSVYVDDVVVKETRTP